MNTHIVKVSDLQVYAEMFERAAQIQAIYEDLPTSRTAVIDILARNKCKVCINCMLNFKVDEYVEHRCWTKHYLWLKCMVDMCVKLAIATIQNF